MHLQQLPSGSWRVAVKHNGVRRTATAKTRDAARLLGYELELELGAKKRAPEDVTVSDLLDLHMLSVKDEWSPTTWHDADALAKRLPEPFRARIVNEVDAAIVAALYRELGRLGWSAHRLRRVRLILSTAWTTAISYRWATINPTRDAKMPKPPHREITPPDDDTVDRILAAAAKQKNGAQFELFLRLAAATGARRGELVALQWGDLRFPVEMKVQGNLALHSELQETTPFTFSSDDRHALVRITRSLVCTTDGITERDTKTAVKGHRTIKLGESLTKRLKEHRDLQAETAGGDVTPIWVFSHSAGADPWRPDYTSREFARVCKKAGVTGVRLHDLRHALATDQLAKGRPIHLVSQRLGHSSTATTQRVYSHWIPEADDMADDIDGRFG